MRIDSGCDFVWLRLVWRGSNSTDSAVPLVDERERYIDQLLAEIESLQVRLKTVPIHSFPLNWIRLFISS